MGQRGQQLGFNDRDVPDDRCRAIEDIGQRAEGSGRIALGEADRRASIADLARVRLLVGEGREGGAGLAGHPEAGLGGQDPAGHLARQRVGSLELRLQAFGRAELLQGLAVAAAAGVEPPGR